MTSARFAKLGLASLLGLVLAGGPAVQAAETKPAVSASKRWESEFSLWQKVSASSDPASYEDYLKQYPNGTFASMARLRLAELNAAGVAKPATGTDDTAQGGGSGAISEKEKAQADQKAAEAARLKAEQEAKLAAEKAKAEEEKLAAEAERKRLAEVERLRKEEQARAEAEAKRVAAAKAEAERKAAEAERKRAEEAAEAARVKAEQQAKAEAARLKAEQEARAAAEVKAKAEAERAAAEAERKRVEAAAEAARIKAEQEAKVAAEAAAKADAAAADAKAKAETAQAAAEAERAKAEEAAEAARLKAEQAAKGNAEATTPVEPPGAVDAYDAEALPTEPNGSAVTSTAAKPEADEAERLARREDNSWSRAVLSGKAAAFEKYLNEFPSGRFAEQARQRLAALEKQTNDGATAEGDASVNDVITEQPAARQKLQSKTTVFQTPPDVREAYLEAGTRALSQRWLNVLGYDAGSADGVYGPRTRSAIAAWQRSLGYRGDGYLTLKQFRQLRESAQFADRRYRQRYQGQRYSRDGYGVYEGPVDGYLEGPVGGGYLEGPVGGYGGYYEGPVERYYDGPVYQGGMRPSGSGY